MGVILLKNLMFEAKLYGYSISELLDKVLKFEGKTLVFLDTETVGLEPNTSYVQLTHVAAMAFDGSTMELLGEYSKKVNIEDPLNRALNSPESPEAKHLGAELARRLRKYKRPDKHPSELLQMTGYYSGTEEKVSEKDALLGLEKFISQYPNVILLAHNATFDIKTIQARRKNNGLSPMQKYPVVDTVKISRFFFIPVLVSMENVPEVKRMLEGLLAKTKYRSYTSSLGKLAHVLGIKMDNWHDAKEDVKMLFQVMQKIIEFLQKNVGADIRKQQGLAAKRFRNMKT